MLMVLLLSMELYSQEVLYSFASDDPGKIEAMSRGAPDLRIKCNSIRSVIVPHHLLAGPQLYGFFRALTGSTHDVKRIVVIGPDHYREETPQIILSDLPWKTPFGEVRCDSAGTLSLLHGMRDAKIINSIHIREHSISSVMPFIAKFFPGVAVITIVVKPYLDEEQAENLGDELARFSDDTLVILSTDFVHYKMRSVTENIDRMNDKIIRSQFCNADRREISKIDNDCRRGTLALFRFNACVKACAFEKVMYSNSHVITGIDEAGTSYFFFAFGMN
jgi:AmmeMemoRadiSam system protein B